MIRGELNIYPPRGNYQIIVRDLQLAGIGQLLLKLEALKAELKKRGWFSQEHKKPLPSFPKTIGVVTSPTGAAIQDILNVLARRRGGFHLLLNPVRVQGQDAAKEIAQAIQQMNEHKLADVLIVGRGGGSIEDLWAFNEKVVAEAIFHSHIPVISAVGHESDTTLADYVADVRAPTPSAAAEIVAAERSQQLERLSHTYKRLLQHVQHQIQHHEQRLQAYSRQPMFRSPSALFGVWIQRLDDLRSQLDQGLLAQLRQLQIQVKHKQRLAETLNPLTQLKHYRTKLVAVEQGVNRWTQHAINLAKRTISQRRNQLDSIWGTQQTQRRQRFQPTQLRFKLDAAYRRQLSHKSDRLEHLANSLRSIAPQRLLERGYSILFSEKDRSIIKSVQTLQPGDAVRIRLVDGEAQANITTTERQ